MRIREINPSSSDEIDLVANRMRLTLVEVVGDERGSTMYSPEWLKQRVLWHVKEAEGKVFVAVGSDGVISGQAIGRVENSESIGRHGYFSTIYVAPEFRRQGIAQKLLENIEVWFTQKHLTTFIYNTAKNHAPILHLFGKNGYAVTHTADEMVQLSKNIGNIDPDTRS